MFCFWNNRKWISRYLDGEMEPRTKERLELHLNQCEGCRGKYERMIFASRMVSLMRLPDEIPPTLIADLERQLPPVDSPQPVEHPMPATNFAQTVTATRPRLARLALAIVAVLASAVAVVLPVWLHNDSESRPEPVEKVELLAEEDGKDETEPETITRIEQTPVENMKPSELGPKPPGTVPIPEVDEVAKVETESNDIAAPSVIEESIQPDAFMEKVALRVTHGGCNNTGFCCFSDERKLKGAIRSIAGVYRCDFNGRQQVVVIVFDRTRVRLEDLQRATEKAGFQVALLKLTEPK